MDIEVLGALSVRENGVSVVPTAPKPRQVLALLALNADQVVSVATLIEELWGETPPRSARTTLQTYVLQLRELIAEALAHDENERCTAKDILTTVPGGYRLESRGGTVDFREFERRAGAGYRAMDAEDYTGAARRLADALSLWNGQVLTDIQAGHQIDMEIRRLEEARLCALDQRIEADLRLGRHRELLSELTVLVKQYRMHESLHGQFMLALHRSGRRGEALSVYQRLRATLVAELGLEPSTALSRLQRSVLVARPELPTPAPARATGGRIMPRGSELAGR
ncbi:MULTISPECIES: AfsR/SARP family transcriptional regulator [Streptomyces]|uniref:AfsR/SARP family transcriptional regulator n=1 Tax=Streptomyces caniscabiei TaxID=2746961 RepID=A0ABU4N0E9_9ACTN|nr:MULTISPECIES: AfsR/SARP family transcriptional regulator [Streptomyces]MBE4741613.1 AfsR/SARP family transcriptional regulator [Streptomyces caniscabiei]MBE4761965.1 AfsR/SARP family transcriptional regulator [Streptomyces caniscabiei]MBE4775261.1 AfsR/SARP family transcriptional regulator [Streptomyces caniscabiei]MBE4790389.1 AfsR/SARP family transcriptional regulator [Streptomyces caniscabiei]MBE4799620.1 AfsR/SARP family transcriptional regulator [Streptomyces caniscabiei]